MNRIVLIGNGFDLANGYKTSYKDFIEWLMMEKYTFVAKAQYNYEDDDLIFKNLGNNKFNSFEDFRPRFDSRKKYSIEYKSGLLKLLVENHLNIGWADIEGLYYEHLNKIINEDYITDYEVKSFQDQFQRIIDYLEEYLLSLKYERIPDIRMKTRISKILNSPITENEISIEFKKQIPLFNLEIENGLILNFNYTETANFYESSIYNLIHIHGELNSLDNPIIFGFGDELDDNYSKIEKSKYKNDVMRFIKSVNYLKNDNYRKLLSFLNHGKYQISIVGHSCGNTDRTLLNTLFEHENCVSIKPFFRKYEDGTTNYFELVSNISRNFKDKKMLRDRVVNESYCTSL